jgi:curved DNA-binding protein CbpA
VRRYHPDNQDTGDTEKFNRIVKAHKILSDPDTRASYDVVYAENRESTLKLFDETANPESYDGDKRIFEGILSVLYVSRRRDADRGGVGIVQLEKLLACPSKHLEFHIWYLREKSWVERLENGMFAITAAGCDKVMEQEASFLRKDRLLSERSVNGPRALKD